MFINERILLWKIESKISIRQGVENEIGKITVKSVDGKDIKIKGHVYVCVQLSEEDQKKVDMLVMENIPYNIILSYNFLKDSLNIKIDCNFGR